MKTIEITPESSMVYIAAIDGKEIGRIEYTNWYSTSKAIITINGTEYKLGPKGFWHTSTEVFKGNEIVLNMTARWQGGYTIVNPAEPLKPYYFRGKGWFKTGYEIVDNNNEVLLDIQANFSWKKFNSGFTITCNDDFSNNELEILLLLLAAYLNKVMQAAAAIGTAY